jgi:hypothetical protein
MSIEPKPQLAMIRVRLLNLNILQLQVSTPELSSIYVSGSDLKIKEIQGGQIVRDVGFQTIHTLL